MALMEGPFFLCQCHLEELGLLLIFPEISKVTIRVWEKQEDRHAEKGRQRQRVLSVIVDGSSRIMIPR